MGATTGNATTTAAATAAVTATVWLCCITVTGTGGPNLAGASTGEGPWWQVCQQPSISTSAVARGPYFAHAHLFFLWGVHLSPVFIFTSDRVSGEKDR